VPSPVRSLLAASESRDRNSKHRAASKQFHLLALHVDSATTAAALAPHSIFPPKHRHQLRQSLPISLRQKRAIRIALPIKLHQGREVFLEKWQEHRCRTRFKEKRIGKNILRACCTSRFYQSLQVARPVRNLGQHRSAVYPRTHTCQIQLPNRLHPQIRTRRPRLHADQDAAPAAPAYEPVPYPS